jgi:hypothetical protein
MSKADHEIALLVKKFDSMPFEYRNAQYLFEITVQLIRLNEKIENTRVLLDIALRRESKIALDPKSKTVRRTKSESK